MSVTRELERLVIRLVGDSSSYDRMLNRAEANTVKMQRTYQNYLAQQANITDKSDLGFQQRAEAHQLKMSRITNLGQRLRTEEDYQLKRKHLLESSSMAIQQDAAKHAQDVARIMQDAQAQSLADAQQYMSRLGAVFAVGFTAIGALAVKYLADFDQAMTQGISIMRDKSGNMISKATEEQLKSTAIELSGRAIQSPRELAKAYYELASAGKSAEEAMRSLEPISKFATAGAFEMDTAAKLLLRAQSALGLARGDAEANASNLKRLGNALIAGNIISQATTEELATSLTNHFGSALRITNKSLEEGIALLTVYSKEQQGAVAGSMAARFVRLIASPPNTAKALKARTELGFKVFDDTGKMKKYADIVQNLEKILGGMSEELALATLTELGFEARIQQAIMPLIGFSKEIRDNEEKIKSMKNIMDEVAKKQSESLINQFKILRNQVGALALDFGQMLVPVLKSVASEVQSVVRWWNGLDQTWKSIIGLFIQIIAFTGPMYLLIRTLSMVSTAVKSLMLLNMGATMMSWKLAIAAVIAAGVMMGKMLSDNTAHGKRLADALEESGRTTNKMVKSEDERRSKKLAGAEEIQDAQERYNELKKLYDQEELLTQKRENELRELRNDAINKEPSLPSIGGFQPEVPGWMKVIPHMIDQETINIEDPKADNVAEWKVAQQAIENHIKLLDASRQATEDLKRAMQEANPDKIVKRQYDEFSKTLKEFIKTQKEAADTVGMTGADLELYKLKVQVAEQMTRNFGGAFSTMMRNAQMLIDLAIADEFIKQANAATELHKTLEELERSQKEFSKEADTFRTKLEGEIQTFGLAGRELELFLLKAKGAKLGSEGGLGIMEEFFIRANMTILDALEKRKELVKKGEELTRQFMSPKEKLVVDVKELEDIYAAGAVGFFTFAAAINDAADKMAKLDKTHQHLNQTIQSSQFGSAEALSRMAQYLDAISPDGVRGARNFPQRRRRQGLGPNRIPAGNKVVPGAEFPKLGMVEGLLNDIKVILAATQAKPSVEVDTANL